MLETRAREFLVAGGWEVGGSDGIVDAVRQSGEGRERLLVFVDDRVLEASDGLSAEARLARSAEEADVLAAVRGRLAAAPGATGIYLAESRRGLSQAYVSDLTALLSPGGGIRVPVQFFDAAYSYDNPDGRGARGALAALVERAKADAKRRVAQPFAVRDAIGGPARPGNGDLVEYLETALADPPTRPRLLLIDGSAGGGKTVAFNDLVRRLQAEFIAAKQARVARLRPIVFLPEHLRGKSVGYVGDLLQSVGEADMAGHVPPEQLRWLLRNGHAVWMFDGLDEFYDGAEDFFPFLGDMLTAPGSRAQILICARDSLLSSSERLRRFLAEPALSGGVEILELQPWGPAAWRDIAWLELEQGRAGAQQSPRVQGFLATLEGSRDIAELAALPFYCTVLLDRFKAHGAVLDEPKAGLVAGVRRLLHLDGKPLRDALDLLDHVVERMLEREHGKQIFRWRDFIDPGALEAVAEGQSPDAATAREVLEALRSEAGDRSLQQALDEEGRQQLLELLAGIAHAHRRTGDGRGELDVAEFGAVFERSYAAPASDEARVHRLRTVLVQFAFFGAGRASGAVDFAHPIVADYLAARYAVARLEAAAGAQARGTVKPAVIDGAVRQAIGAAPAPAESVFFRALLRAVAGNPALADLLAAVRDRGTLASPAVLATVGALLQPPPRS